MTTRRLTQGRRKGAVLIIMTLSLLFIVIPAMGLAIDGAVVYTIRARLQSATDAAAVSAARSISRGLTPSEQYGSATATAVRFFRSNINSAWRPLTAPDPVVTFPAATSPRTVVINVASTASAPTYFMKILNVNSVTVTAVSQTVRREVKIIMVLDRSGSLSNSGNCGNMREAAKLFVDAFVDGRDQLGMVSFGSSYRVDFPIATNFKTTAGTKLPAMINSIGCVGGTNGAAAYSAAYNQLIAVPEPGVLNVILFFTDGQPNNVHMTNMEVKGSSSCTNKTAKSGVISAASDGVSVNGIYVPVGTTAPPVTIDNTRVPGSGGCSYVAAASNVPNDIVALTRAGSENEVDAFGNLLTGYKTGINRVNGRIVINHNPTIENVGINALDSAGTRARDDANTRNLDLMTFAIGLGGTGAAEDELLHRLANTNTTLNTNKRTNRPYGMYIKAENGSQLDEAFAQLASETMRYAK